MQTKKNTLVNMLVAGSLLLPAGITMAEPNAQLNVDTNPQKVISLDDFDIKLDLEQTLVQLQQQLKHDNYNNARKALTETSLLGNVLPLLQH
ncbi:hypothetical protein [Arsukibacterium sp.]|uniref:hypothetical protein n=1 Tax=Arsukibacterium sp. TaxID=1977258 RepID=UPI001BD67C33|nr:hypothetical protein [Arsukibacterium sp.]